MLERIKLLGIVPVVKIDDAKNAAPLAKALCGGGLPCAEITFRTDAAEESIRRISGEIPDMLVGTGTVLTPEQADAAKSAGAKFAVSPGFNPRVVKHCIDIELPVFPGCSNPSDIEKALELGLSCVKFFPAEQSGGIAAIKAMAAPYNILFIPTGGINEKNLNDYLSFDRVIACGGSWMADAKLIAAGNFDGPGGVEELARNAVYAMLGLKITDIKPGGSIVITPNANNIVRAENFLRKKGVDFTREDNKIIIVK